MRLGVGFQPQRDRFCGLKLLAGGREVPLVGIDQFIQHESGLPEQGARRFRITPPVN